MRYDENHNRVINRTLIEVLARVYVINCPRWALGFYKSIEWWIPAKTRSKVRLLGADYRDELLQVMDAEMIDTMLAEDFADSPQSQAENCVPNNANTP